MGTNIYASSRVELEFEECPYCHQNTATKFEFITAATGAWDIAKYSCLSCSRQYIQNIRERVRRPILVRASSDDGAYEYTEESELWRSRLNYKVSDNKKEQDSASNKLKPCLFCSDKNTAIGSDGNGGQYIDCSRKHIVHFIDCTKEEAINLWNTRPAEDALQAEIRRLREALFDIATGHYFGTSCEARAQRHRCKEEEGNDADR